MAVYLFGAVLGFCMNWVGSISFLRKHIIYFCWIRGEGFCKIGSVSAGRHGTFSAVSASDTLTTRRFFI